MSRVSVEVEADRTLWGADGRTRWALALAAFGIFVFTDAWMKAVNGAGTEPPDNGLVRSLYYPGYLAGFGLIALGPWRVLGAAVRMPLVWALVAYAFASMLWSIDPPTTERRALALFFCTLTGTAIAAALSWRELTRVLAAVYAAVSAASLLAAVLLPKFGRMQVDFPGAWSGLFIEKNGLGAFAAETLVFCAGAAILDRPRRWLWAGSAALGAGLLALSTSKTSLVVAVLGLLCLLFSWAVRRGPASAVAATFAGVVSLGLLVFAVVFSPSSLLGFLGKDATLTGRTRIWAAVMRQVATRPHTGFGYGAVWTDQSGWGPVYWVVKQYGARPTYAHNGWVDLWLALGDYAVWLGAATVLLAFVLAVAAAYRRSGAILALPYLAMFAMNNLTESSVIWYNSLSWVLFVVVATRCVAPEPVRGGVVRAAPAKTPPPAWPALPAQGQPS